MQFAAWDARLSAPVETGGTVRSNAELAAAMGNRSAQAMLVGPAFPESLTHLWDWHVELRQGLGEGMTGRAPLTWASLDAWARWTGVQPYRHEVTALFALDAVARHPDAYPELAPSDDTEAPE